MNHFPKDWFILFYLEKVCPAIWFLLCISPFCNAFHNFTSDIDEYTLPCLVDFRCDHVTKRLFQCDRYRWPHKLKSIKEFDFLSD